MLFLVVLLIILISFSYQIYIEKRPLQVVFLDVGQGDSILIQKGDKQILIDGGPSGKTELAQIGKYLPYFDREIEIVIATHPDKDHIGGLVAIGRNYRIGKVFATLAEKDTAVFREWTDVLEYNKIEIIEAKRGSAVKISEAELKIIFPKSAVEATAGDSNVRSVVSRLDYGGNSFLFTGDIETAAEKEILGSGENIDVDFLKIAHHGSKNSSSSEFLDAATPDEAIISVSAKNSYGHPHEETLRKLSERNIEILRTDNFGNIEYICSLESCQKN